MKLADGDPVLAIEDGRALFAAVSLTRVRLALTNGQRAIESYPCAVYDNHVVRVCLSGSEGLWWARGHAPETADALEAANKLVVSSP